MRIHQHFLHFLMVLLFGYSERFSKATTGGESTCTIGWNESVLCAKCQKMLKKSTVSRNGTATQIFSKFAPPPKWAVLSRSRFELVKRTRKSRRRRRILSLWTLKRLIFFAKSLYFHAEPHFFLACGEQNLDVFHIIRSIGQLDRLWVTSVALIQGVRSDRGTPTPPYPPEQGGIGVNGRF